MARRRQQIVFPRTVLLVEVERRCADERCNTKNRIGLTKEEARVYHGYECVRCARWHEDTLTERDVPDWWEELHVTGLTTLRPQTTAQASSKTNDIEAGDASEVVARLSAAWRAAQVEEAAAEDTDEGDAEARAS
jgi:hypothetical protein